MPNRLLRNLGFVATAVTASLLILPPAWTQTGAVGSANIEPGIRAYAAKKYNDALQFFLDAASRYPDDPSVRYYLAVCYHALHMRAQAEQQYNWVLIYAPDSSAASLARIGLKNLSAAPPQPASKAAGTATAWQQQQPAAATAGNQPDATGSWPQWATQSPPRRSVITTAAPVNNKPAQPVIASGGYGRIKVIEFYTDW